MNEELGYDTTGLNLTENAEGCRLTAYRDSVGVLTIGTGHTGPDVYEGMEITQDEANALLLHDINSAIGAVKRLVKVELTQGMFDALVDLTFNEGQGNLAASTLLKQVNAGNFAAAADEFQKWNKAGGQVLAGLTRRRAADEQVFLS